MLLGQQRGNLSVEYRLVSWRYHDSNPNLLEGNVDGMESTSAQEQNQVADRLMLQTNSDLCVGISLGS